MVIHGGPTGISLPAPLTSYVYHPVAVKEHCSNAKLSRINGLPGEGFPHNVCNLGVGDAWDVLRVWITWWPRHGRDPDSMGCMGWSRRRRYISAFLTTNTDRLKAISVGPAYPTDDLLRKYGYSSVYASVPEIHPWSDPGIYALTSPITTINQVGQDPTLIQHGEFDRRVPIINGYELHQGL